ncbi:hypothetical protein FACS189413_02360 [Bacteroidia bacterium]|nr:hypothetical protein FACS189463_1660 [Bacteroidia bacterium]GHU67497.1 hypothetical protein FACS189413_02360 [Bacteroidia bacterium]
MKSITKILYLTLWAAAVFTACDEKEDNPAPIVVANTGALTQNVFADDTQGKSAVTFTTTGAWTSKITDKPTNVGSLRATTLRATADAPTWLSITPESGDKAGSYTIAITLVSNTTGADRTAVITVSCEGTDITITITQKGTKEDGTVPTEMTQAEIIALLTESFRTSFNAPELKMEKDFDGRDGSIGSIERNVNQKRMLEIEKEKTTGAVVFFEYKEDLTLYVYEDGNKHKETLPDNYWESSFNLGTEFGGFTWTVSDNTFTGVGEGLNKVTVVLNENRQVVSLNLVDDDGPDDIEIISWTFSYSNVNPTFPAGFNKADFPLKGTQSYGKVTKINGQTVYYNEDSDVTGVGNEMYADYGVVKLMSDGELVYMEANNWDGYNHNGRYDYTFVNNWVQEIRFDPYGSDIYFISNYTWDANGNLSLIRGDQRGVSREGYLSTTFEYSDIEYTLGNIDIGFLLASGEYYTGAGIYPCFDSHIGKRSKHLIHKLIQDDEDGDKYDLTKTFRYEFNDAGYITAVYSTEYGQERLLYSFEY